MNAEQALTTLLDGNQRFVAGHGIHPHQDPARRQSLTPSQAPFATILGCADSRVAPEIIFDQGLGDLFVNRVAGHVVDAAMQASIGFSVLQLGVPLVVVLGHQNCGAVQATLQSQQQGQALGALGKHIQPSLKGIDLEADNAVEQVVHNHVQHTVRLLEQYSVFAEHISTTQLHIQGAYYDLDSGFVKLIP